MFLPPHLSLFPPIALFALASLCPLALLWAGFTQGGLWTGAALLYMTLLTGLLDQALSWVAPDTPEGAEFPAGDALLLALGGGALLVLPVGVWAVAGPSGFSVAERVAGFVALGLWLGQVAIPAGHELIHRGNRLLFGLGVAVYVALLFGHHASAHRLVHHRHAASPLDPNTARSGEGYYAFFLRAWMGSFRAGWKAERARRRPGGVHPYVVYTAGAGLALLTGFVVAGWPGVAVWAGLALHAQSQLLLSDYVQHYGLIRARLPDGRLEPVAARHSWNAPHWFTARLLLNAPRHSDHHAHPSRPYPALRLPSADEAPMLPWSLPVACVIALVPPLWRRLIAPHLAPWRRGIAKA